MKNILIKETQINRIIRKTGRKPCECKCAICKQQCHTPCLGTPQDIERLIDSGYVEKLELTFWMVGMMMGVIGFPVPMLQARKENGYCIFFHDGLCELHDKGLKPTEGRLSYHSTKTDNFKPSKSISWNVAKEWLNEDNIDVINRVTEKMKIK